MDKLELQERIIKGENLHTEFIVKKRFFSIVTMNDFNVLTGSI